MTTPDSCPSGSYEQSCYQCKCRPPNALNCNCWSPDSQRLVNTVLPDPWLCDGDIANINGNLTCVLPPPPPPPVPTTLAGYQNGYAYLDQGNAHGGILQTYLVSNNDPQATAAGCATACADYPNNECGGVVLNSNGCILSRKNDALYWSQTNNASDYGWINPNGAVNAQQTVITNAKVMPVDRVRQPGCTQ